MGFSLGFGSKKGSAKSTTTSDFSLSEDSASNILTDAFREATSTLSATEQQNLSSLLTSLGLVNSATEALSFMQGTEATTQAQTQQSVEQSTQAVQSSEQSLQQTQQATTGSTTGTETTSATQQQQTTGSTQESLIQSAFATQDIAQLREILPGIYEQALANYSVASGGNIDLQVDALARQLSEEVLPGIISQEATAGAYNSSTAGFLANDAIARAAEQAAGLQVEAAKTAGAALDPITQLVSILKGAETTSTGTTDVLQSILGTATGQTQTAGTSQQATTGQTATQTTGQQTTQTTTEQLLTNILEALTSTQQATQTSEQSQQTSQQTQEQQQTSTTQSEQQATEQEASTQATTEETSIEQEGESTSTTKGKNKASGFSLGFS